MIRSERRRSERRGEEGERGGGVGALSNFFENRQGGTCNLNPPTPFCKRFISTSRPSVVRAFLSGSLAGVL